MMDFQNRPPQQPPPPRLSAFGDSHDSRADRSLSQSHPYNRQPRPVYDHRLRPVEADAYGYSPASYFSQAYANRVDTSGHHFQEANHGSGPQYGQENRRGGMHEDRLGNTSPNRG
ncbi:hypothetical protein PHISP_07616 [Aspergillus sp. HF37]|nr:hypothetical protein PHISP_07616 [Aspergillus sp. HF37]